MGPIEDSTASVVALAARLCLGLFFLQGALGKVVDLRQFIRGVVDYRMLPEPAARIFGALLPWGELALALALILGVAVPLSAAAAMVLLACFITAVGVNLRRGQAIRCNCHGIAATSAIGWGTIARNGLLLALGPSAAAVMGAPISLHRTAAPQPPHACPDREIGL